MSLGAGLAIALIGVAACVVSIMLAILKLVAQGAKITALERRLIRINVYLTPSSVVYYLNRGSLRLPEPTVIQPGALEPDEMIVHQYMVHSELDTHQGLPNETWVWS